MRQATTFSPNKLTHVNFMKTKIQNLFIALPVLLLLLPAVVQAQDAYSTNADGSIYTYSTNADGSANIVAYAGPPWVVTIPTNINGLTVTSIGTYAFNNDTSLTSVTIPGSVTSIGHNAFEGCTRLTNATIDNGVTNIGDETFVICTSLTNIAVSASNPAYSSLGGVLFDKAQATLLEFPGGLGGGYTITNTVTSIGIWAFELCTGLRSVTIPNSVTSIGQAAFSQCSSLTNATIGSGVTSLGQDAFEDCYNLTSVTIPGSVTNIGVGAFYNSGLTNVTIPNSVTSIGGSAFVYCTRLTKVYFTGNAPSPTNDSSVFSSDPATVYYLPGTTGWGAIFDSRPTAPWFLPNPQILNHGPGFGVQPGGFGFTISWATNVSVVVEAATNLANPVWIPVSTNPLTGGTSYFSDPQWTNYHTRFYRLSMP
jgi:BspA type Leucine rich repeat region (6 copies)